MNEAIVINRDNTEIVLVPEEHNIQKIEDNFSIILIDGLSSNSVNGYSLDNDDDCENEVIEAEFKEIKNHKQKKQIVIDDEHWFSEDDLKELSRQIVALDAEIDIDENEMDSLKSSMRNLREAIESKNTERRKLSRKYSQGFEVRSIVCIRVIDYDESMIKYYDINTNELIKAEPLNENGLFDKQNRNDEEWN